MTLCEASAPHVALVDLRGRDDGAIRYRHLRPAVEHVATMGTSPATHAPSPGEQAGAPVARPERSHVHLAPARPASRAGTGLGDTSIPHGHRGAPLRRRPQDHGPRGGAPASAVAS